MNFMNAVENTINEEFNTSTTENGAIGYRTSGKELLDLTFAVASMRSMSEREICKKFARAYVENPVLAMRWLFFARDIRGGLGERRLFRAIMTDLALSKTGLVERLIPLIAEYGRYDDMWCLLGTEADGYIFSYIKKQMEEDLVHMSENKEISLLAKWLPSPNTSSIKTRMNAKYIYKNIGISERDYRRTLSKLRSYIDVVERKMSANNWTDINYESVPSRANLIYANAFYRNDRDRRADYLTKLQNGEVKINAGTLFPHDIVHRYSVDEYYRDINDEDKTIEALWKALPDNVNSCGNTIVVADGSGSMSVSVDKNSKVSALEVANALAIYFAEHSSGEFKNKYITFSTNPQFVDLSNCNSLHDKLETALLHSEMANTNIEKVFDLILVTAINNHMKQEDLPKNVLIISDMEFDECATCGESTRNLDLTKPNTKLFKVIENKFKAAGYQLPRLVFWNVNSRTGTIPVRENNLGVALVSGFSTNVCKMVMSGKTDPYECLVETLMNERYDAVEAALH